jgi:hypothetical protein
MRYWVCINNEIIGPLEPEKLAAVKGFSVMAWACPEGGENAAGERRWKRAVSFPELAACFFPDYPKAAQLPPGPAFMEEQCSAAAPVPPPPPSPDDAVVIAQINRKLDQLLRVPAVKPVVAGSEPLNKNLDVIGKTMEAIRDSVALQDTRIHSELEPLNRKLDQAEREIEGILERVRQPSPAASLEPLNARIDLAENVLEHIRDAVEKQDASMHSGLEPISERVAQAEKAIEEENNIQRALLEKISLLDQDVSGLRAELKKSPAAGGAEAARVRPHPARAGMLTIALAGAGFLGFYRVMEWAVSQGSPRVYFTAARKQVKAARRPAAPDAVLFVKSFGSPAFPLEKSVMRDAAARGADPRSLAWAEESGSDGLPRVVADASRSVGSTPVYYYFSADIPNGRVIPLNRGSRRALERAVVPGAAPLRLRDY